MPNKQTEAKIAEAVSVLRGQLMKHGIKAEQPKVTAKSPLAKRCYTKAIALRDATEMIIRKLETYQSPDAAKDLNDGVEITLRISLETMTRQVEQLNCPAAYFPKKA